MLFSLLVACVTSHPVDLEPTHTPLDPPRPEGDVRVSFSAQTGSDQGRRREAGLLLTVEAGAHRYAQIIASCDSVGTGNASLSEPGLLASAWCGDRELHAYQRDGAIVATDDQGAVIAQISLP